MIERETRLAHPPAPPAKGPEIDPREGDGNPFSSGPARNFDEEHNTT